MNSSNTKDELPHLCETEAIQPGLVVGRLNPNINQADRLRLVQERILGQYAGYVGARELEHIKNLLEIDRL